MSGHLLFSGYYGFDNSGDDAILYAIIQEVRKRNPNIPIQVLSYNPGRTHEIYQVSTAQRFYLPALIRAIKNCNLLISGGGSLLQDVTSSRSLYYYLGVITLAKLFNKKVYIYANGVGPIHKKINRKLTQWVLNKADLITLRDEDSFELVRELKVKKPKLEITSDPVYALDNIDSHRVENILKNEGIPTDRPYIGVGIRSWKNHDEIIDKLSIALDEIYDRLGIDYLFIPLHYPDDLNFSKKVSEKMRHRNTCHMIRGEYSVDEIKGLVGRCELMLAMRLHALIYAVTELTPIVGLVYDPKVKSHLKGLEIEEFVNIDDFEPEDLIEQVLSAYDRRKLSRENLKEKRYQLQRLNQRNVDHIFELLEEE